MSLTTRFSVALRFYRERAEMSQDELADAANLDRTYISQLERGLKSPTLTTLGKLAACLGVRPEYLIRPVRGVDGLRFPDNYFAAATDEILIARGTDIVSVPATVVTAAINAAHELIDDLYRIDLDIAAVLGMRNLSAFIGELFAAAIRETSGSLFRSNPHQDGYPDLLLMDEIGTTEWRLLEGRLDEKGPFSPFPGGGIEVKATCGAVPSPRDCRKRGFEKPSIGDMRIGCMTSYDWKAHHRETNNLVGVLWDFIDRKPRIAAVFYSSGLVQEDWGRIVQPREGGGRTTSVSIMAASGVNRMYEGWLAVLRTGGYTEFLNRRNTGGLMPESEA